MKSLTFKEARAKMVDYIQRPFFASREDTQTTNSNMLVKLNQAGIITIDSQEGIIDQDEKQRAYLVCIVPPDVGKKLIEKMNKGEFRAWEIKRLSEEDMNKYYDTYEGPILTFTGEGNPKTTGYAAYPVSDPDVSLYMGDDEPYDRFNISEPKMMVGLMDTLYGRHASEEGGLFTTILKTMSGRGRTFRSKALRLNKNGRRSTHKSVHRRNRRTRNR